MNTATLPKPGQRVELVQMGEDPAPIQRGQRGTVLKLEQWGASSGTYNIHVAWDNGRTLALLSEHDNWKVL